MGFLEDWWNGKKTINPVALAWNSLPPEAKASYSSVPGLLAEMSPGASVRDAVEASGQISQGLLSADPRAVGLGAANMGVAALGLLPGARAGKVAQKAAQEAGALADVARPAADGYFFGVKAFTPEEIGRIVPAVRVDLPDGTQKVFRTGRGKTHADVVYKIPDRHFRDNHKMDDGFFDPKDGKYYTRDEMSARMGPREAADLADHQVRLKKGQSEDGL